ncbi:MAG TPA: ATP-binding protein [Capillimicrobium sp.]
MGQRAVWQFALSGLISVLVIGVIAVVAFRAIGREQALDEAKDVTRLTAAAVVEPALTQALVDGDREALERFDWLIREGVLANSSIQRIKLWTPDGRIVYSDEPRLIGQRYALDDEELEILRSDRVQAEVSDLESPENRFERGHGELLEVYLPAHLPSGEPLLFETYRPAAAISDTSGDLTRAFIPALLGGLVALWLVNLPLAAALSRRVRRAREEREAYLQAAMHASEHERRRIAADLHDGVVQDLNGLSLQMAAEARAADARGEPEAAARLRDLSATGRQLTRGLRHALVDIYPPTLHREGLAPALADLAESVRRRGPAVAADVEDGLELPPDVEALLFRIAQESLRNVVSHADASQVRLRVGRDEGRAVLVVGDDGRGFDPAAADEAASDGHLGLRALRSLTVDAGGRFVVRSAPGAGTEVRAEVPVA